MKYTVEKGDTLYGISNQFGVSVTDLKKINNLSSNTINVGQVLTIPSISGTNPDNVFTYTVKKGDTLYGIGQKYGVSVSEIISLNNLKNNNLSINQKLLIPEKYSDVTLPEYSIYEVVKGDTLYSISKKFDTTVDKIIKDNNLNSNTLSIGQKLKIEGMVVEECYGSSYDLPEVIYVVKKGDSLYSIAKKYGVSVSEIKAKNKITSNLLSIGQKLKI